MFDSSNPNVKESWFKEYGWFDFYWDAEDMNTTNMSDKRGHTITV